MIKVIYYNLSLRKKITTLFLVLLIVPLSLSSVLSYSISKTVIESRVSSSVLQTFNTVNERMEAAIQDLDDISKVIFFDDLLLNILRKNNSDKLVTDEEINKMDSILANILNLKRYMSSIYIYTNNGRVLNSHLANDLSIEEFRDNSLYQKISEGNGGFTFAGLYENKSKKPVIIVGRKLIDPVYFTDQGVLVIALYHEFFNRIYKDIHPGDNSRLFIVDTDGQVLFHTNREMVRVNISSQKYMKVVMLNNKGSFSEKVDGEDSLVVYNTSAKTGLKLVGVIPQKELTSEISRVGLMTMVISLISIFMAMAAAWFISRGITSPLGKLISLMEKVKQEDFTVKFEAKYNDEISEVAKNFNRMVERVKELIERIKEEQYMKKSAELKALQAQINPHFLYNTLTSIYWSARKAKAEEAAQMTSALSSFFKLGLNKGNEITTIRDEIEHAKSYLVIQQFRYKDKFDYRFEVDEQILNCKTVKLVLQPLLENSIIHGIEPLEAKGLIRIVGVREKDVITLKVIDNGVGFNNANSTFKDSSLSGGSGYGLKNVVERIHLYFGKEYGICFRSIEGEGTVAEVTIPYLSDRGEFNV